MFDYEVAKCLENVSEFKGVFPRDQIPSLKSFPFSIVVSTDKASQPGRHWVALRCTDKTCEYFDSFGLPPLYSKFKKLFSKKILAWNSRCIQHSESRTCGQFCIAFVKARNCGVKYNDFIKKFNNNLTKNDKQVLKAVNNS